MSNRMHMFILSNAQYVAVKVTIMVSVAMILVAWGILATLLVHVYGVGDGALNSGIMIGTDAHNVGFEWTGTPGFFIDNN